MKISNLIALLAIATVQIAGRRQDRIKDLPETAQLWVDKTVGGLRHFWRGFQIDIFDKDQSKLDSRCLDNQSKDDMAQVYYVFEVFTFQNLLDSYIALWSLFYDDYVDCHYEAAISVFVNHCNANQDACTTKEIIGNLKKNVFHITTVLMTVGDIGERTYIDEAEYEEVMEQLGKDASELGRLVIGIRHSRYEHGNRNRYHDYNTDFEDDD